MPEPMTRDDVYRDFSKGEDRDGFYAIQVDAMADEILRLRATLAQRREGVSDRQLTAQEVDDLAWAIRRFEEGIAREGHMKRDHDRAKRLRVLLRKLESSLIPTEATTDA